MRISDWSSDVCSSDLLDLPALDDPAWQKLARSTGASSRDEILADIGLGKRLAAVVARRFAPEHQLVATTAAAVDEITSARSAPILIQGNEGQAVQLAPCCGPLPGDPKLGRASCRERVCQYV